MKFKIVYSKPVKYFIDGDEVSEATYRKKCPRHGAALIGTGQSAATFMQTSQSWPRKSDALGCSPVQCDKAQEQSIKLGVPTEFDKKTGQAILLNNAHQRDFLKALGKVNLAGGYGTVTG